MSSHPVDALSAYLDDELSPAERREVAAHLATCGSCARHLRELSAVDSLARDLPPAAAPAGYHEALPGRVRQRLRAGRPLAARAPWVWPLAAALALAVLAPLVLQQGRYRRSPAAEQRAKPVAAAPESTATAPPATAPAPPAVKAVDATSAVARDAEAPETLGRVGARRQDAPRRAPAAPPAEEPPPAQDARAAEAEAPSSNQVAGATVLRDEAPAAPSAYAPPPPAAAEEAKQDKAQVQVQERDRALGAAAAPLAKREASVSAESRAFAAAAAAPLTTGAEARRARQDWLRFVADHPRSARLDDARVRLVEAAVAAFRFTRDPADRAIAEREARAYLATPGPQAARIEAALRRLDEAR
jgi:hypothetical protein